MTTTTPMRPRSIGEILDAGVKVYLGNAKTLMAIAAVVVIPMQVLAGVILLSTLPSGSDVPGSAYSLSHPGATASDASARLGAQALLAGISLIVTLLTAAACVKAVSDAYMDQPSDFATSLRFAVRRLPGLFVMEILFVFGLIFGFVLLVVPAIWLYCAWSVGAPALLIERLGPASALGRSRSLVKGRWFPTAAVLIVATLMVGIVTSAFEALFVGLASLSSHPSVLLAVVLVIASNIIATVIAQPFHAAMLTILYYDLRVRHEGYDLQVLAEQLGLPEVATAAAAAQWAPSPAGAAAGGPESVGQPGGPPFWPPPPGWTPGT